MQEKFQNQKRGKAGFSLIEILVASAIFGVGIYALINLTSFFKQGEKVVSNALLTSKIILSITEDIMSDSIYIIPTARTQMTTAEKNDPNFLSMCKDKEFSEAVIDPNIKKKVDIRYYDVMGMYICRAGESTCCVKGTSPTTSQCLYSAQDFETVELKQKCYTAKANDPSSWANNRDCAFKVEFYKTAADIKTLGSSHMNENSSGAFASFPDLPLSQFHIKITSKLAALSTTQDSTEGQEKVFCMRPLKSDVIVY